MTSTIANQSSPALTSSLLPAMAVAGHSLPGTPLTASFASLLEGADDTAVADNTPSVPAAEATAALLLKTLGAVLPGGNAGKTSGKALPDATPTKATHDLLDDDAPAGPEAATDASTLLLPATLGSLLAMATPILPEPAPPSIAAGPQSALATNARLTATTGSETEPAAGPAVVLAQSTTGAPVSGRAGPSAPGSTASAPGHGPQPVPLRQPLAPIQFAPIEVVAQADLPAIAAPLAPTTLASALAITSGPVAGMAFGAAPAAGPIAAPIPAPTASPMAADSATTLPAALIAGRSTVPEDEPGRQASAPRGSARNAPTAATAVETVARDEAPVAASLLAGAPASAAPVAGAPLAFAAAAMPDGPATVAAAAEAPQDFATLVARLGEAREASQASGSQHVVRTSLNHGEFGQVALQFRHQADGMIVSLASADTGLAGAVQAAAATLAANAGNSEGQSRDSQTREGQQQHAPQQQSSSSSNGFAGNADADRRQDQQARAAEARRADRDTGSARERQETAAAPLRDGARRGNGAAGGIYA